MTRNIGHVTLSYKAIGDMLSLPKGHRVERIFDAPDNVRESVVIRVTGSKLPPVDEGAVIPAVELTVDQYGDVEFKAR
jgi:hypothetical protein